MTATKRRFRHNSGMVQAPTRRGPLRSVLNPVTPGFFLLGAGTGGSAELTRSGIALSRATLDGVPFAIVRSRSCAGVIVHERTYEDACVAIEHVRDASRFVPIAIYCDRHEWEDSRGPTTGIHPVTSQNALARLISDSSDRLQRLHAAVDAYAQRCGCSQVKAELLWRVALGLFHDDLAKALGVTSGTKDKYVKELRVQSGVYDLNDMVGIATGTLF